MIRTLLIISLLMVLWSVGPLTSSDAYMNASNYATIQVRTGDSVWSIASKYVTAHDDIRELTYAINQLNGLQRNGQIFPGQVLKIPLR